VSYGIFQEAWKQYAKENEIDFKYIIKDASRMTIESKNKCDWRS